MKRISIDGGKKFVTAEAALAEVGMIVIALRMDDDIREQVALSFDSDDDAAFIREYLKAAKADIVVGELIEIRKSEVIE